MAASLKGLTSIISQLQKIAKDLEASGDLEADEVKDITEKLSEVNIMEIQQSVDNGTIELAKGSLQSQESLNASMNAAKAQPKFHVRNVRTEISGNSKLSQTIYDKIYAIRKAQDAWMNKGKENTTDATEEISTARTEAGTTEEEDMSVSVNSSSDVQREEIPRAPQVDHAALTAKQEKAIETILAKLKNKKEAGTSVSSIDESHNVDVRQRRYHFGHSDERKQKANWQTPVSEPQPEIVQESVTEIDISKQAPQIEEQQKESEPILTPAGEIILEKHTSSTSRGYVSSSSIRQTFVDIKPRDSSRTSVNMTSLDAERKDITEMFSSQETRISETSPIKAELENILTSHAQSRQFDSLPRSPPVSVDSAKSEETDMSISAETDVPEGSGSNSRASSSRSSSSGSCTISGEQDEEQSIDQDQELNGDVEMEQEIVEAPPVPAPRKTKPEFRNVSSSSQGSSIFTMRQWSSRDDSQLW